MLDKSMPHIGVLMEKEDTKNYPRFAPPPDYRFCNYQDGFEVDWGLLQYNLGQTDSFEEAVEIFKQEFLSREDEMKRRCLFIKDDKEKIVGTSSLWFGKHFGSELQRIHWVAIDEAHQNKGLAKALLTKTMDIYNELGFSGFIYLTSQTWSYKALNIYLSFGFKPYMGEKPINWKSLNYEEENKKAWDLINSKLSHYKNV